MKHCDYVSLDDVPLEFEPYYEAEVFNQHRIDFSIQAKDGMGMCKVIMITDETRAKVNAHPILIKDDSSATL